MTDKSIPNKIHYCWFRGNPLPADAVRCINSWKKYCPDYEIIEWNEKNFDMHFCEYIKEARKLGKWAFISDYARFKILYEQGGLYFDTDVEIIRSIDPIVEVGAFMGFERDAGNGDGKFAPGLGLGAYPNMEIYKEIIDLYNNMHLVSEDGKVTLTTVVVHITNVLKKYGLKDIAGIQEVRGIKIYPKEYFCPVDYRTGKILITDNTYTIHHYTESWLDEITKKIHTRNRFFNRYLGETIGKIVGGIFVFPLKVRRRIDIDGWSGTMNCALNKIEVGTSEEEKKSRQRDGIAFSSNLYSCEIGIHPAYRCITSSVDPYKLGGAVA